MPLQMCQIPACRYSTRADHTEGWRRSKLCRLRAPPSTAVVAQLEDKLGFDLPLDNLRYWLLGIPDPSIPFDLTRNTQDRALRISQAGWTIDYDEYMPSNGDVLPKRLVLNRSDARVRIAVDHWQGLP